MKMKSNTFKMDTQRKCFFTRCTLDLRNSLPLDVIGAKRAAERRDGLDISLGNGGTFSYVTQNMDMYILHLTNTRLRTQTNP